jgi:two-component system, OmpR family, phosphate regulon sensor histidine kinase PhoR
VLYARLFMKSPENEVFTPHTQDPQFQLQLLQRAMGASCSGIIITDCSQPDEPIIYCNEAFEQLSGYSQSEIIGRNCRFLQGPDTELSSRKLLREAVDNGMTCRLIIKNYRKDGSFFWNELTISPVKDETDKVTHFIGVQNDMTALIQTQHQLSEARTKLEEKVQKRTEELSETNLFLRRVNQLLQEEQEYALSIVETVRESLLVLSSDFRVIFANKFFYNTFQVSPKETEGKILFELGNQQWNIPKLT